MRRIAFLVGLGAAATAPVTFAQLPARPDPHGMALSVLVNRSGPLDVRPAGRVAGSADLRPGRTPAAGSTTVVNETGQSLRLRVRAMPPADRADRLVRVRVTSGAHTLFSGTLDVLRDWQPPRLRLAPGGRAPLSVRAWLPGEVRTGYESRRLDVALELLPRWEPTP